MVADRKMIIIDDVTANLEKCVLAHIISQIMNGQPKDRLEKEYDIQIRESNTKTITSFGIYRKKEDKNDI